MNGSFVVSETELLTRSAGNQHFTAQIFSNEKNHFNNITNIALLHKTVNFLYNMGVGL